MSGHCGSCRHAEPTEQAEGLLVCRRYPPQIIVTPDGIAQAQPAVSEADTCGEHAPALLGQDDDRPTPPTPPIGAPAPLRRGR
jgi:hypothetical protein